MTEPDWTDATPQPVGYASSKRIAQVKAGDYTGILMAPDSDDYFNTPVYLRPIPQQPEANQWGAGYQDCRQFVVQRLCSQLPPADAIRALDALGWPTDDASLRAVGVMR